jgi:hypothetical protein
LRAAPGHAIDETLDDHLDLARKVARWHGQDIEATSA